MNAFWIGAIGILATVVLVVAWVAYHRRRLLLGGLTPEESTLHDRCVAADKAAAQARRAHRARVREAERALAKAEKPEHLASAGRGNYVTPVSVCVNSHERPLDEGVEATLDAEGDVTRYATQRTTATRVVTGAMLAGPAGAIVGGVAKKTSHHKADDRELYLIVLARDWQEVARLNPAEGQKARSLMHAINVAARNATAARVRHEEVVATARAHLEAATADTREVDAALAARQALGEDPYERAKRAVKMNRRSSAAHRAPAPATPERASGLPSFGDARPGDGPQDVIRGGGVV